MRHRDGWRRKKLLVVDGRGVIRMPIFSLPSRTALDKVKKRNPEFRRMGDVVCDIWFLVLLLPTSPPSADVVGIYYKYILFMMMAR